MILKEKILENYMDDLLNEDVGGDITKKNEGLSDDDFKDYIAVKTIIEMMPAEDVHDFGKFLYRMYFEDIDTGEKVYEIFSAVEVKEMIKTLGLEDPMYYGEILYHLEQLGYDIFDAELSDDAERSVAYEDLDELICDLSDEEQEEYKNRLEYALDGFGTEDDEDDYIFEEDGSYHLNENLQKLVDEGVSAFISSKIKRKHAVAKRVGGNRFVGQKSGAAKNMIRMRAQRRINKIKRRISGAFRKAKAYRRLNKFKLKRRIKRIAALAKKGLWSTIHHKGFKS